jgi:hypothetical protein
MGILAQNHAGIARTAHIIRPPPMLFQDYVWIQLFSASPSSLIRALHFSVFSTLSVFVLLETGSKALMVAFTALVRSGVVLPLVL